MACAAVPPEFARHFRCPFAKVWLQHGAERAAQLLGVPGIPHGGAEGALVRRLTDNVTWGTCAYTSSFTGPTCVELRGDNWTAGSAQAQCSTSAGSAAATVTAGARCPAPAGFAGWCGSSGSSVMTLLQLSPAASTCAAVANACATFARGSFVGEGQCAPAAPGPTNVSWAGAGAPRCTIAPGPMGAAHQLAQSPGYSSDCQGTPAQRSPYMWPLRWTANVSATTMSFGSDAIQYESQGRVWYMLDRNWKRYDVWYQRGVQRAVGQTPCKNSGAGPYSCNRTEDKYTTVLHRNAKMVFIQWTEGGANISNCSWVDLSVIGNIRPDWYMDDRGVATDVQYLGDTHVYYQGQPRLVKQWRKKDFASQYFTMSMQRLPGPDGVHWPLILNIPGEGFGDDGLQHYHGHRLLNDSDADAFLLDDAYVAAGGSCPQLPSSGTDGPPTGQAAPVPSNLEVDPAAWRKSVFTASPVWTPPAAPAGAADGAASGVVPLPVGGKAEACYDEAASVARVTVTFASAGPVWAAIGLLRTDECLMTPRGGGDGEAVFALPDSSGAYRALYGAVPAALKQFAGAGSPAALGGLTPLLEAQAQGFRGGLVELRGGSLKVGFSRAYPARPRALNLSYALGAGAAVGYHAARGCVQIPSLPTCPDFACPACPVCRFQLGGDTTTAAPTPQAQAVSSARHEAKATAGILVLLRMLPVLLLLSRPTASL